jgi:hypothetical protein
MSELIVGNRTVPLETANEWVAQYTDPERVNPHKPYGYPWYDTYNTGNSNLLVQGDLLAPVLLNVRPSIAAFASLDRMRPSLNKVLKPIGSTDSMLDIDDIGAIGRLYMPLDETPRPFGVKATTLAKVLHRKRPNFVPLFDGAVRACYFDSHLEEGARLSAVRAESWADYMTRIAAAIKADILASRSDWESIQNSNLGPHPISLLRAFDIVAWNCGTGHS